MSLGVMLQKHPKEITYMRSSSLVTQGCLLAPEGEGVL